MLDVPKTFKGWLTFVNTSSISSINSVLVDVENLEASENQIEKWKQGKEKLYFKNITITVYELVEVTI